MWLWQLAGLGSLLLFGTKYLPRGRGVCVPKNCLLVMNWSPLKGHPPGSSMAGGVPAVSAWSSPGCLALAGWLRGNSSGLRDGNSGHWEGLLDSHEGSPVPASWPGSASGSIKKGNHQPPTNKRDLEANPLSSRTATT